MLSEIRKTIDYARRNGLTAAAEIKRRWPQIKIIVTTSMADTDWLDQAKEAYRAAAAPGHGAADCLICRRCERACPQGLKIISLLRQCKAELEK